MAGEPLYPGGFVAVAAMKAEALDPGPLQPVQPCPVTDANAKAPRDGAAQAKLKDPTKTFIEIVLVDKSGKLAQFQRYQVTAVTGEVLSGALDENGFTRIEGIDPGSRWSVVAQETTRLIKLGSWAGNAPGIPAGHAP